MLYFLLGFLTCWLLIDVLVVRSVKRIADRSWQIVLLMLPLIIISSPFLLVIFLIELLIIFPFHWVRNPVSWEQFDEISNKSEERRKNTKRIFSSNVFLCIDRNGQSIFHKAFLVKVSG